MDTLDETLITDDTEPAEETLKEARPLPPEDTVREFEEYLLDIGVRI